MAGDEGGNGPPSERTPTTRPTCPPKQGTHKQVDSIVCADDIDRINLVRLRLLMPTVLTFSDMRDLARTLGTVLGRAVPLPNIEEG